MTDDWFNEFMYQVCGAGTFLRMDHTTPPARDRITHVSPLLPTIQHPAFALRLSCVVRCVVCPGRRRKVNARSLGRCCVGSNPCGLASVGSHGKLGEACVHRAQLCVFVGVPTVVLLVGVDCTCPGKPLPFVSGCVTRCASGCLVQHALRKSVTTQRNWGCTI